MQNLSSSYILTTDRLQLSTLKKPFRFFRLLYKDLKSRISSSFSSYALRLEYPGLKLQSGVRIKKAKNARLLAANNTVFEGATIVVEKSGTLRLRNHAWIGAQASIHSKKITIGRNSAVHAFGTLIGEVSIGDNVMIAKNVFISSGKHHYTIQPELPIKLQDGIYAKTHGIYSKEVIIEDDVWIGANCVIMSGISIGKGSIIGANSVVTADVPPYSVVAGSPAKKIKNRLEFSPSMGIKASELSDYPYFYSGFVFHENLLARETVTSTFLQAYGTFSVFLENKEKKPHISLTLKTIGSSVTLLYQSQSQRVTEETATVTYDISSQDGNMFVFMTEEEDRLQKDHVLFEVIEVWLHD